MQMISKQNLELQTRGKHYLSFISDSQRIGTSRSRVRSLDSELARLHQKNEIATKALEEELANSRLLVAQNALRWVRGATL